jgi:metal-dependent amidase/aminoacylase/carboxypeptidase family protein
VTIGGTVRTFDSEVRKQIPKWMEQLIKGLTEAHDASYEFDYDLGYGSVVNDGDITSLVGQTITETFGEENCIQADAIMGSEDFSAFSDVVPGCFVFLGAGNEKREDNFPHHHPRFDIKEESLIDGVHYFVHSTLNFLKQ